MTCYVSFALILGYAIGYLFINLAGPYTLKGQGGSCLPPPQFFADQSTLFKPEGDDAHPITTRPSRIFRPSYGPILHSINGPFRKKKTVRTLLQLRGHSTTTWTKF